MSTVKNHFLCYVSFSLLDHFHFPRCIKSKYNRITYESSKVQGIGLIFGC